MNYYFLAASLPPLSLDQRPELSFVDLKEMLELNLSRSDYENAVVLCRYTDLLNIRSLLMEEEIDLRGNLGEKELDEALLLHDGLPIYVFDFLDRYQAVSERIKNFSLLLSSYFNEEIPNTEGFLHDFLVFERSWRLVMTGLRSKVLGRNLSQELQHEDLGDSLVMQLLAQKDSDHYEPPAEFKDLRDIFISFQADPWRWNKAFASWRFHRLEELVERPLFTIDFILGYMARLMIVEDLHSLDQERGRMVLETFKTG